MFTRLIKLSILFLIIGICIYFVSINSTDITLSISSDNKITASSGTIVLGAFSLGIFLSVIGGLVFAIRGFFRELGYKRREQKRLELEEKIFTAREASLTEPLDEATKRWQRILNQNYHAKIAHLSYCNFLIEKKLYKDASTATDEAKKLFPDCIEVHLLASEVQESLGNLTSALDNLVVVLSKKALLKPTVKAAKLSYKLLRFEDTLEFIDRAEELAPIDQNLKNLKANALAHIVIRDNYQEEQRKNKLVDLLVKYPSSTVALENLAKIYANCGQVNESAQCLFKIFRISNDLNYLKEARSVWLSGGYTESAISAVKTYAREAKDEEKWLANLELAKTHLLLSQDEEAKRLIDNLSQQSYSKSLSNAKELAILKAMIAYRAKDHHASALAFQSVERLELGGLSEDDTQLRISSL